jgi:hypothetical protein
MYGYVSSMACSDSTLYISGGFRFDTPEYHLCAAWIGRAWQPMDQGLDTAGNSYARTLIVYGKQPLAGGHFYLEDHPSFVNAIQWDGERWREVGSDFTLFPRDLLSIVVLRGKPVAIGYFSDVGTIRLTGYDSPADKWIPFDSIHTNWSGYSAAVIDDSLYIACDNYDLPGGTDVAIYDPYRHTWSPLGRNIDYGRIQGITKFRDRIVIGGDFTMSGITYLAQWNGNVWQRLTTSEGYGRRGEIVQLAISNHDVYAIADTDRISTTSSYGLVRWDGVQWQKELVAGRIDAIASDSDGSYLGVSTPLSKNFRDVIWSHNTSTRYLGLNVSGSITTILPDSNNLYVAGSFNRLADSTDIAKYGLAHWDRLRDEWTFLDSRINRSSGQGAEVRAVATFRNNIVVGGSFDSINGIAARNVARWDGTRWHSIGEGFSSRVLSLAFTPNGVLYAGGEFLTSGNQPLEFLASSNGNDWDAVSGSPDWPVHTLAATDDALLIGGESFGVMRLDLKSKEWSKPGGGISSRGPSAVTVRAIALDGDEWYLGGSFSMAGDKLSYNFAHWSPKTSSVGMAEAPAATASFTSISPNPVQDAASITFNLPRDGNATLAIYSTLGTETEIVASRYLAAGEHTIQWHPDRLPNGIYYCRLRFEGSVVTERIMLLR